MPGVTQTGRGVLGCPTAGRVFLAGLGGWVRGLAGQGYHQCKGAPGCARSRRPGDRSIVGATESCREVLTPCCEVRGGQRAAVSTMEQEEWLGVLGDKGHQEPSKGGSLSSASP